MATFDLTLSLDANTKTYPSDPDLILSREKEIKANRSLVHNISFGTHTGTHCDSPAHIFEEGALLSDMPLEKFHGTAVICDIENFSRILDTENEIDGIIFNSGWYKFFTDPEIYYSSSRPKIPDKIISFCVDKKLKFFGCDLPSVDESGSKNKPNHNALLGNDIIIYESLGNLSQINPGERFSFYGFPLSIKELEGSPVRAIAIK